MRLPEYMSPTSVKLFYDDIELFYSRYLSDVRSPREPQTKPMSIGSAFDAYVKSYLYTKLFGAAEAESHGYALKDIFNSQVEEHNRTWAWEEGKKVFEAYKNTGCLADLLLELEAAVGPPRFEFSIKGDIEGVPLLGKPDIFFINEDGARVIYDWKVNGYCSNSLKSPMRGFVKLRENGGVDYKIHKDCHLQKVRGVYINIAMHLEDGDRGWADQLSIYSWLLGEPIGSPDMITGIDQICGPASRLRFATHRLRISPEYQDALFINISNAWDVILSGWIFRDLSEEESAARCLALDSSITDNGDDQLFNDMTRG
jgi:hypothetical protein